MSLRLSLSLLFKIFNFFFSYDTITKTMEGFSGYPSIQEPLLDLPNQIKIVEVSNLSIGASPRDIKKFFSACGNIEYVVLRSDLKQSQIAFVTFEHSQGAQCAVLLSGTKLVDLAVTITLASRPPLQQAASLNLASDDKTTAEYSFHKTKDVFSSILAKGYVLGKNAVNKAKAFDEKHQLTSKTTDKVVSFDKMTGISEKVILGTSLVNDKVREMDQKLLVSEKVKLAFDVGTSTVNDKVQEVDQKLQVSEKVKSAITAAGETVTTAKSAVLKSEYVSIGASWLTGTFDSIAKAAAEVGQHVREKVAIAEEEQRKKTE